MSPGRTRLRVRDRACAGGRWPGAATRRLALAGAALLLAGCAGSDAIAPLGRAPDRRAAAPAAQGVHEVKRGDTLYAIAWQYGLDYRDLARWNAVPEPYTIYPGQQLRVRRPAKLPPMPRAAKPSPEPASRPPARSAKPAPAKPTPRATRRAPQRVQPAPTQAQENAPVKKWTWPARGKVVATFGRSGGKGIDIAGERGAPISAAAPGRVVYSGSGLRGYGRLIIVKHNKRYLSAYAHNERLHVKEGDIVVSGQRIADMGSSGAKTVKLHFEIRRDGKPVDPIRHLPR